MPLVINIRSDFIRLKHTLTELEQRQLPFAMARALTNTAKHARIDMQGEMRRVFDRPLPWTINSLRIEPATKRDLQANIHFKDFAPKGTAAGRFLRPQIEGGSRELKRSERRLQAVDVMQQGTFLVPRSGARLDAHGNLNRGQMVKVLSNVRALGDQSMGASGGKARGKLRGERYFAVRAGSNRNAHLKPGIYHAVSRTKLRPIYGFVRAATYTQRLDFFGFAERAYARDMPELMREAMEFAMRTAQR